MYWHIHSGAARVCVGTPHRLPSRKNRMFLGWLRVEIRLFRDSRVASETERRPFAPSCIRTYTPILRAGASERRIACFREKIASPWDG